MLFHTPPPPLSIMSALQKFLLSTPVKRNANGSDKFAAAPTPLNKRHEQIDSEMRKRFVGPVPVKQFLKDFLPVPSLNKKKYKTLPAFSMVTKAKTEAQMYDAFVRSPFVHPPNTPL